MWFSVHLIHSVVTAVENNRGGMHEICCTPECAQERGQARKLPIYTLTVSGCDRGAINIYKVKINLDGVHLVPLMW